MKYIIGGFISGIILLVSFFAYDPGIKIYNRTGQIVGRATKAVCDTITPTSATSFNIPISSTGFAHVYGVNVNAMVNSTTISNMAFVSIQSFNTSSITVNLISQNPTTTTILGIPVLSGAPLVATPSLNGIILNYIAFGD